MTWLNPFQVWLTESQSLQNAQKVVDFLYVDNKDWKKESISALLGNMRHESSINPNMYEYGYNWADDRGFGLVQWTPRSKFWDWGAGEGYTEDDLRNGDSQLARIDYEVENNIQWIPRESNFNGLTFKEFRTNSKNLTVDQLTEAFTWGYERPNQQAGEQSMPARKAFANKAFNELDWSKNIGGGGNGSDNNQTIDSVLSIVNSGESKIITGIDNLLGNVEVPLEQILEELLKPYLYKMSHSYYSNTYIKATLIENLIKLTLTGKFDGTIDNIFDNLQIDIDTLIKSEFNKMKVSINELRSNGGGSSPSGDMYFPVKIEDGINFWYPPYDNDLTKNMDYGLRTTGEFHSGYDIGGGGYTSHKVYAIRDCIITDIRQVTGGGYSIFMEHETDDFHSMYLHLKQDSAVVNVGDRVKAGQHIATMGNTGGNYAIHLHVEISPTGQFHTQANTINSREYLKVTGNNKTSLLLPK